MMPAATPKTLFDKLWDAHLVSPETNAAPAVLYVDLHLIHEVTSPQAFQMLRERGEKVVYPRHTFATVDHIAPTDDQTRPFKDPLAEQMMKALEQNTKEFGIKLFDMKSQKQGIVHVIGPELGITQPGMTIACASAARSF